MDFIDRQNRVVKKGDYIMYITDGPRISYGKVLDISRKATWGYEHWKITVFKTSGEWLEKPRRVTLTEPTVFKCGETLVYPEEKA
jgi:hypothetical protein